MAKEKVQIYLTQSHFYITNNWLELFYRNIAGCHELNRHSDGNFEQAISNKRSRILQIHYRYGKTWKIMLVWFDPWITLAVLILPFVKWMQQLRHLKRRWSFNAPFYWIILEVRRNNATATIFILHLLRYLELSVIPSTFIKQVIVHPRRVWPLNTFWKSLFLFRSNQRGNVDNQWIHILSRFFRTLPDLTKLVNSSWRPNEME